MHCKALHDGTAVVNLHNNNYNKQSIYKEVRKDIQLCFFKFSGIKEVEYLKEDKYIEEKSQMLPFFRIPRFELIFREVWYFEELMTFEQHYCEDNTVIEAVEDNSSPHLWGYDMFMP